MGKLKVLCMCVCVLGWGGGYNQDPLLTFEEVGRFHGTTSDMGVTLLEAT
jgi:hypothetical protein